MFRAHVLIIRRSKLHYTASGIITPIGVLFYNKFISCLYMFRAHVLIIRRSKLHYTASGIITLIGVLFYNKFISCLYMFRAHVLFIRRSKLHYTASGIITLIGVLFYNKFISCLYMFRAHVLIIRRSKLHYTASGIIGFVIPDGCITLIQFYPGVLVLVYLLCLFCITNIVVLLTVHLSIFISVVNQLDAQKLRFTISSFHASTCFEHMCSSSGGQNCIIQHLVS